jgi:hypothetical protein
MDINLASSGTEQHRISVIKYTVLLPVTDIHYYLLWGVSCKGTFAQFVNKFPAFTESEVVLPLPPKPAIGPYPETVKSNSDSVYLR